MNLKCFKACFDLWNGKILKNWKNPPIMSQIGVKNKDTTCSYSKVVETREPDKSCESIRVILSVVCLHGSAY